MFTSIALFNILITPLNAFPWVINGLVEAWISVKRVNAFLQLTNLDFDSYYEQLEDGEFFFQIKSKVMEMYFTVKIIK